MKGIKDDPDNPFGSLIKAGGQSYYIDADGKRQLSLINKRAEEGDWGEWADKLPSQFLSKQSLTLVNKQLNLAVSDKMAEFDEICSLTNPTVKKSLLKSFADDCDSAAVHLQAAALPRQKYQVILPITSMKDTEVYAPNYKNGETLALVRFPHLKNTTIPQKWSTDGHQTPWAFNSDVLEGYPYLKNTTIPLSLETCNMYYGETKPTKLMYGTRQVVAAYCGTIEVYRY